MYDRGILKSNSADVLTLCVGNVRVGGTGKSPFVEYLVYYFMEKQLKIATLSRGYGRKTKGFLQAKHGHTAYDLGDESYQYFKKFKNEMNVFVGENRVNAVNEIRKMNLGLDLIVLDDAFQHRALKADYNIVLTEFNRPFYEDSVMPHGRLRESRKGVSRANAIIVTKCPDSMQNEEIERVTKKCQKYSGIKTPVYFTKIAYSKPISLFGKELGLIDNQPVVLLSGIDNPVPFFQYCKHNYKVVEELRFPDHHNFTDNELKHVEETVLKASKGNAVLLTTEKDASRIAFLREKLSKISVYYLPIKIHFLQNETAFKNQLDNWTSAS